MAADVPVPVGDPQQAKAFDRLLETLAEELVERYLEEVEAGDRSEEASL